MFAPRLHSAKTLGYRLRRAYSRCGGGRVRIRRPFNCCHDAVFAKFRDTASMPAAWSLHATLEKDTVSIGDLPLSRVLVIKDANYPWLLLVPRRPDIIEIIDLDEVAQAQLIVEINRVARALQEVTKPDKLNIAALGNVVPQLHVHVIARRTTDAAWPRPVWGVVPPLAHDPQELDAFIAALRRKIWLG
jgi:diadenosine tetraphosphate (Ap4A) HIT family hydrolase